MKKKLAVDNREFYDFKFSQRTFEELCPIAASKYDELTMSVSGRPKYGSSLGDLGEWLSTVCKRSSKKN